MQRHQDTLRRAFRGRLTAHAGEPWLRLVPTAAYMLLIFGVSSVSGPDLPPLADDRVLHFVEYFILGVLMPFSVIAWVRRGSLPLSWLLAAAYAASDEWHQSFVAERDASMRDFTFDLLGITCALVAVALLLRESRR